jgi:hypothetical protein
MKTLPNDIHLKHINDRQIMYTGATMRLLRAIFTAVLDVLFLVLYI